MSSVPRNEPRPIRNHHLIGFAAKDLQVSLSQELRIIFKYFVITNLFGVVAGAI